MKENIFIKIVLFFINNIFCYLNMENLWIFLDFVVFGIFFGYFK